MTRIHLPPAPKLAKEDVQKHLSVLKQWAETLELEIQKYEGILRYLDPDTAYAPKGRLIGWIKPYLYTVTGATEEQIVRYMIESGFMRESDMRRFRQALSQCINAGTLVLKGNNYSLSPSERGAMTASPREYNLPLEAVKKYANLK